MKKVLSLGMVLFLALFLVGCGGGNSSSSSDEEVYLDFLCINQTGGTIEKLYVAASESDKWGENVLVPGTNFPTGTQVEITFDPTQTSKLWDIRIEDASGNAIDFPGIDLSVVSEVTLYFDGTNATAETK
ncbi:MAG: hypothetical protein ACRCU3_04455 [Eubacteriaceae bacterium]